MPPKAVPKGRAVAPSREAIAFALAIVNATPAGMSAIEYAHKLRDQLKHGRLEHSEPEKSRYLDLLGYAQQRVSELEKHNRELQSQVINLERAAWVRSQFDDPVDAPAPPSKRQRTAQPTRKSSRAVNKTQKTSSAEESMEADFDVLAGLGSDGTNLLEQTWLFNKVFIQSHADPEVVCFRLVSLVGALGRVISKMAKCYDRLATRTPERPNLTSAHDKTELSGAILACSRTFSMILVGIKSLDADSPGKRLPGLVIYECAKLFSTALDAIESSARQSAATAAKKNLKLKNNGPQESLAARGIAQLLRTLIGFLDKNNSLHHDIFDGFAFVLFERVGQRLYYTTFGRHRGATIEDDMAHLSMGPADVARREMESLAIRLEVKALSHILEQVMNRAPDHMDPQPVNRRPMSMKNISASRSQLSQLAKDRLQRTLVACMFGDKVDDPLKDILTKPRRMGAIPYFEKVTDKPVEEWWQDRVWELVGWDIMARETEWMDLDMVAHITIVDAKLARNVIVQLWASYNTADVRPS
ncbi:hypothetical protein P280DRAFT_514827 [Massarina eburnea CBS 473.64]|uniref:Uncharacterized protein n=1 Tax=Massarina eburnea CBS 473.64 TaxID=1395130 RepID=A0A6A6SCD5_9PLEO|nr:hypothetical protein P280DRAFT_514827 [Massarina eburnea CBS 473.64]